MNAEERSIRNGGNGDRPKPSGTVLVRRYLHGEEDSLSDLWDYDAEQQDVYHYSLYEVAVDLEVDLATGKSRIVKVDGSALDPPQEFA